MTALRDELFERVAATEKLLHQRLEQRGQLAAEMKILADDRQLALKQLQLATMEKRLQDLIRRWQVLAVTYRLLETIRTTYEQQRQPETLQEASGYLNRLTQGRYLRVWTPLGQQVLRVDDGEGHALPVEVLSRGTREQLFLSLRLALSACYARRGAMLPLVLDDVLVNFDAPGRRRPPQCCATLPPRAINCWSSRATSTFSSYSSRCACPPRGCPTTPTRNMRRLPSRG